MTTDVSRFVSLTEVTSRPWQTKFGISWQMIQREACWSKSLQKYSKRGEKNFLLGILLQLQVGQFFKNDRLTRARFGKLRTTCTGPFHFLDLNTTLRSRIHNPQLGIKMPLRSSPLASFLPYTMELRNLDMSDPDFELSGFQDPI